ncbi:interleukin-2 receptor subunit alpha-like [Poecile atricapillus]|uniref:interleukin-2 receptor subunit alpha-like n=1 Tax=Poecile atricapillus TaxID=48891 RepID=UPI0027384A4F|nr:interleukin-2 receptor subunit alpha-like [Poecile atricapillus]
MWTSPMELKWLLMWVLFGFIKGENTGICPDLPRPEFADVTAEMYPPQTKLYYKCDPGYDREAGAYLGIQCKSKQQGAVWEYPLFKCFDVKNLLSVAPTMELELTQKPEREPRSPAAQKQRDLSESKQKDFCGPPKTVPHASISLPQKYYVGQVLHFKCQTGYDKRPPTSGNRTCKEVNGKIVWTPLDMRCTNDSNQWPPQTIGPGLTLLSSFPVSSGTLPVTGFTAIWFVLLMIPTAFV